MKGYRMRITLEEGSAVLAFTPLLAFGCRL